MSKYRLLFLFLLFAFSSFAQVDHPKDGELFRDDVVAQIHISLPPDSLAWILAPENQASDYHFHATFMFDNGTVTDTIEDIGFRLKGNTSRGAPKKSFKISFNTYESGRKYYGVEKINLNGNHNDPSVSRSKICSDLARDMGLPAPRANHVRLYINGDYFGVYTNIEHIDEEFVAKRFNNNDGNLYKCLYPAELDYRGSDPELYKAETFGRRPYDLKTNKSSDDYSDLAHFIDILNNTPTDQLPCELEEVFNVDDFLKTIVFDILTGNWDGYTYNKNNYYLYHNTATGQFEYITFDLDNTMGIDWLNKDWGTRDIYSWSLSAEPRPLYTRLLAVPEYRNRFSYYMDQTLKNTYKVSLLFPYLDEIKMLIDSWVMQDDFYPRSYGFSIADFRESFEQELPYFQTPYGIKPFITARRNNSFFQIQLNNISPVITEVKNNHPTESQEIQAQARVRDDGNLTGISFCYFTTSPSDIVCVAMKDDGLSNDGDPNDGYYGIQIPAINTRTVVYYQIRATDDESQESTFPACGGYRELFVGSSSIELAINEFLASNNTINADEEGEYDDWVEIYNYGTSPVYLGDKYLSDNPAIPDKWAMPDVSIAPGEYLLFWTDDDEEQGEFHTNFKLSAGGEYIGIFDQASENFALIDGLDFDEQISDVSWGRLPNGSGSFQALVPTPAASNMTTSIDELSPLNLAFEVHPNPFNEFLHFNLTNPDQHLLSIELVDLQGRVITARSHQEPIYEDQLPTTTLTAGFYVILIKKEGQVIYSQKLFKE